MLSKINDYLLDQVTPERASIFTDALKLIHSYEVVSPIESVLEIVNLTDTYSAEQSMSLIESIIVNTLQEILANQFIITRGDLHQRLELLKGINLLEHFIDSDVIINMYDESVPVQEMLLQYLEMVTSKPIEYFDEFIIDVRPKLIDMLISKHTDELEAVVENNEEESIEESKMEIVKAFAKSHPEALAIKAVTSGLIKLGMDITLLINLLRSDIYKLSLPSDIAAAIYSIALVSDVQYIEVPKTSMYVVNMLYDELDMVSELKYLVTSFD